MYFLIDAQLPPALAHWLARQGHQEAHVFECFPPGIADSAIWLEALRLDAVILTKDEDFHLRALQIERGPQVVWLRVGNTSNRALMEWFLPLWPQIVEALENGERVIEVM